MDALKEHWRLERRSRERKKKIHLVVAITAMVAIALAVVGIRVSFKESGGKGGGFKEVTRLCLQVLFSPLPSMSIKPPKTPTFQVKSQKVYIVTFPISHFSVGDGLQY